MAIERGLRLMVGVFVLLSLAVRYWVYPCWYSGQAEKVQRQLGTIQHNVGEVADLEDQIHFKMLDLTALNPR